MRKILILLLGCAFGLIGCQRCVECTSKGSSSYGKTEVCSFPPPSMEALKVKLEDQGFEDVNCYRK